MAVNDGPAGATLSCGRSVEDVWEGAGRPADEHERRCPYCQDARRSLLGLRSATEDLLAHDARDPGLRVSASLKASVMRIARTEIRRSRLLPLEQPRPGELAAGLTVSEMALADVVREAADDLEGVRARRCAVDADQAAGAPAGGGRPASVTVTLRIAVSARTTIPATVAALRRRVVEDLGRRVGVAVTAVDVVVEDVYDA